MMSDNPLSDLSKPITVLIEKVSEVVGGIARPSQIRRVAKAKGDAIKIIAEANAVAEITKAEAEIEIADMQRRAELRWAAENVRHQMNIENITAKALPYVNENANPENMDNDWIANLFDKCRIVSDPEMQSLWARVLATEANEPGTLSKRTVNLLSDFDKSDAELFTKLCGFGWSITGIKDSKPFRLFAPIVLITYAYDDIYKNNGINLEVLNHLEAIGLIKLKDNHILDINLKDIGDLYYYGKQLDLNYNDGPDIIGCNIGCTLLTKAGEELAPICGSKPVDGFYEHVKECWGWNLPADEEN